ncbi:protocadherin Fat 1a isoform X1 [Poecilia latipinna]|uniref:protocadherin Fat 1a isoform X1 n=1 Tax=Poecilia latipinna TaxID=48699 RepID=UPI00072E4AD8|nr:PREDICTED: protocadherin Fat 1 isoform X1 [Poecilia latipinna]XP_014882853.1 PREDICTED: protocadherin Fat 1 isoform X1 [Poecilia latipinna]
MMGKFSVALLVLLLQLFSGCAGSQRFARAASMQFTHSVYNATIYENSAAKTYLESHTKMGIYVTDPTWEIRYKIISGDNENLFKAEDYLLGDFSFLRIRTKGGSTAILNREVKDHYVLTVKASERSTNLECRTRVKVQVLDTNDLRPLFSPTSYSISLPENTAIRSSVAKVMATDADIGTNGEYYYSFREWTDMFAVHPTSGVVTLTGRLDYSETKLYELEILAVDRGMKLYGSSGFSSMAKLTVRVEQANEHAPVITAVTLSPSDADHDPTYAVVTVEDKDLGPNGEISSLSVVAGDPLQQFKAVRSSPGSKEYKIKAVKEVDWDSQPFGYNLTLQAKDKGTPPQFSSAKLVHITSAEFQKGPPVFEKAVYRVNLSEFAPLHTPVTMVTAVPRYPHQNYAFKHSSDKNRFSINADTGLISTAGPINAAISAQYEIEVITSDKKAATKVIVDVIDVNNNAPEFQQTSYKASVDEKVPSGTSVVAVKATDLDKGENGYVTYSITNLSPQPFVIDYFSGVISTSEVLDYELMPRIYNLKVRASDWGSPFRREVEASVTITLNNLNDNKPLFENIDCEVTVPRDHGVGEQITTASAIDADELQLVRYFIKSGNDLDLFEMNPNSGLLSLKRTLSEGEAAKVSFHSLHIVATDGEHETRPMTMNITVITARKPVQVRCVETGVATMLAEKLLQGSKIHGQTEPEDNYMDIYSVNRYSPLFDESFPSFVEVREDLPVGARVIHLTATDPDSGFNGKLVYVISGGDAESRFIVDMETGWLLVYSPLDRETTDHYTLNITVYDLGIPQKSSSRLLDVKILDANDNSPQFLKDSYSIEISESTPVGTEIIQVDSTDRDQADNGIVKYSILGGTDHFAINEMTGVVTVTKLLDRERYPFYVLKIAARDQAVSEPQLVSTVPLKITLEDVNDNPPKFVPPNYRVKVREDLPIGTVIMWLEAHDPDVGASSQVRYSLIDNGDGHFEVDKLSGALRIVQNLDYETKQVYNLTAKAKDKGKPISLSSACFIEVEVVDVNENLYRPFFRSFVEKGFIKEDALIGTSVMTVSAEDEDSGRDGEIRYSIRDGSGLGIFSIDEETGAIRTQELLDHETTPHYWLTVYAMDRGVVPLSAFVEVYIEVQDVNDNAPQTSEPVYYPSVMENSPKDVSIIQINAADPDSKASDRLSYRITSGNPQGFFAINTKTGLVSTTSRKLDREQQDEHILEVTITDHGVPPKSTTVRVIVQVLDDNDNRPLFLEKIYKIQLPERERPERERATKRDPVYRVIASDKDVGPNAEISYSIEEGDEHGKFFIEPKTGLVSSKKFSSAGEYDILTIKAVDNGRPQKSSTCRLHIEWIPKPEVPADAAPLQFEEFPFTFSVMESDPVAHMVGVVATESSDVPVWFEITDGSEDSEMFYILQMACDHNCTAEGGNYDSRFDVGKASGTLIVAQPLDAEQKSNYNLTVEATDGTRTVSTQVLIRVIDTNNHRPQFTQQVYVVNVPEDEPAGTEVLQISAVDRDEKNKLTYTLLSSTDPFSLRKFRLDPGTGILFTTERLDHETMHRHILTVMVRDQDIPVKRNLVRVIVDVDDTNDNAPWFIGTPYSGRVFESASIGSAVLQVTALDKDKGYNAEVIYSIESGNIGNSFAIDPVLGTITVGKELDCSSKSAFELVVKASDNGAPPLFSTVTVNIAVTVSDNAAPRFTEKEFSAEVSELAPPGSFVSMVTAISQSSVFYQIRGGNVHNVFDINPNSGVVVTQQPLDYETMSEYKLIIQGTNMAGLGTNTTLLVHLKDENDNAPVFSQREFKGVISELASINSIVLTHENTPFVIHASDADCDQNARLIYQIVEPFAHNYFAIDSSTGAIRSTAALDYEQRSIFRFTVQVHDLGMPRLFAETAANVTIEVIDVNDCPPLFSQELYEVAVIMPTYKGVEVVQVNATDLDSGPNSKLLFSISEGNIGDKFKIDPVTGIISIQNVTQLRSRYELKVRVSDGRFASAATVKVTVKENKENKRKFTQDSYQAYIQENSSEKKTLAVITAVGNQVNEPLFYRILNPDNRFKVSSTSGVVSTTGIPFDREAQDSYDIIVEVTEEKKSEETAHILVTVTVEDVNDNKPMFVNLPYHALVQFDADKGHVIRQVTAVDKDIGPNADIHYSLKEPEDHFDIHSSGEILLKKKFEKDSLDTKFVLVVVARDNGKPPLSAEVEVPVTVVNKAMPVFERPFYSIEIPENIQLHSPVLHVQANDSEGPRIVYTISEGDPFKQFSIDFNTGVIHVIHPLDFETHPAYKLKIRATDSLTGAHSEVFVDIILEDVNDNAPVFLSNFYYANISEAAVIGTSVLQVVARDSDTGNNKEVFYQLVEERGKSSDYFTIDRESGIISTSQVLDHEEVQQHKLRVRAVDGGVPALISDITVTVDITDLNDNAPVFTQHAYQTTISELAPRGHFVSQVQASDADSSDVKKLVFSIIAGNEEQNFAINKQTGAIVISNHRRPHMQPFYNLTVAVSDGVFRNSAVVMVAVIGANFHNPTFSQTEYMVEVIENSPVGTLVAEAEATDDDEGIYGQITYHIVNELAKDKFSINGKGEIFTLQSLDRENTVEKVIPISLIAKDGGGKVGFCVVNVIVTDANDNSPQFRAAEYKATIASDAPRGTTVLKIAASDADEGSNADIEYSIEADVGNVGENFEIHKTSGVIVTKESLIGLEDELYAFFVKAKDTGNPPRHSVVQVYIRIVSPEMPLPKFAEPYYRHTVAEDLPIGTEIDIIQAESEQPVIYSLVRGSTPESNEDEVFVVDRDTGALKLEKRLDHETAKWYQLTLLAQAKHETYEIVASVNVNIQVKDVNDNKPIFEADPYEAITVENLPSGTQVIQVKATDFDSGTNGHVVYSLDPTQASQEIFELFAVSSETGWVTTLKELDREKTEKYIISVLATDQGDAVQHVTSTSVEVTVADVNDNPPRFTAEIYKGTVSEDDPPPSGVIAILSTTDEDSEDMNKQVNYFITGGDPLGQFAIEHLQNEWKVSVRKPLDREVTDNYLLNITASDGIFTAKAVVEVKVLDANDNHPVCEKSVYSERVPEDSPAGRLILQVSATDADIRSNAQISYELQGAGAEYFIIDSDTGELKTLQPLDREEQDEHRFRMRAVDGGGRYCEAEIRIAVEDVNDNPPQFSSESYSITVFENTEIGTLVGRLLANDVDAGLNSDIVYSLADSADGFFSIDEQSGVITLERPLDREVQSVYELKACASDRGSPRHSSLCEVVVSVLDINDNPPVFEHREYTANLSEDVAVGTQVVRVQAASRDADANGEISYSIISGNEHGRFSVDPRTGDVFVIDALDYEASHEYYITVEATDGGSPPLSDIATVNINLTDVNDNKPIFSQDVYTTVISEDAELGKAVLTVVAEDSDGPSHNHIRYSIVDGNQGSPFTMEPLRGELKVARQLDRERMSGYTLKVVAVDNGVPPLSSSAIINIDISDVNDNPPLFSQANYSLIIQENRPKGTSILQLAVSDRDASHNGPPFTFTIVEGNEGSVFHINQQGALVTTGVLSRKTKEHYLLQAQVSDSGKPQLSSTAFVSVRIIEESVYPPAVLPLDIFVSVAGDEYPGGVLGKIHATDQDIYDTLTYSLAAPASSPADESRALFSVSASDGKIIALRPLDVGQYPLNVTVTDGRFTTPADVNVHIRQATRQALDNSIAVRFGSIAPEEFIGDYWRNFQRALRNIAGVRRSEVQLVSLQPEQGDLDVLLTLERSGSPYQSQEVVFRKLNSSAAMIEDMIGVRIVRVVQKLCAGLDCPLHFCDEVVSLDKTAMSTYSTARLSFVTPRHVRTATCQCDGGKCPVLNNVCENSPCPEGMDCVADPRDTVYSCVCPEAKKGKCSDGHSLTFSGNGYVKYRLMENDNKELMKLSLRLRTFSSHATVMYAKGTDYSILEIVNGRLQYKFDCGSGPGLVSVHSAQVNDGEWHSVSLEVDGNYAKLVLDQVHAASGTAPGTLRTLNLDNNIYFGGHVRQHSSQRLGRSLPVANGLRGCMEAMALNGLELPLNSRARRAQAVLEDMVDVAPGCALAPEESCSSNPCTNGGSCVSLSNGGYFCKCPSSFMGSQCELAISPCASNPCLYGGTCVPRVDDFYCQCRGQYSGQRCQLGPYCRDNPCKNSGTCIDSLDGPVCECVAGFQGDRCLSDIDECIKNPCANGGQCQNTYGSFKCNCSLGFRGQKCELPEEVPNQFVSTPWNIGLEEVIGIVVFLLSIFILVLFFIFIRKRACRSKSKTGGADKHPGGSSVPHSFLQRPYFDSKLNKNIYSDIPPQVPVRPISYTPSIPSDSRNNLDRNSFEGSTIPEHPEFTTFNPDSVHGHRKTVAVCSVAPNLPPPPPSNSVSDSDSIQKPNWDYDYDTKVVDLDPCLTKKPVEESACQLYNTRGSMSEVHSLSSFQSESCDDNESFLAHDLKNPRGYHWDTSDWMPSVQLPGIQEFPHYEVVESPAPQYNDPSAMDTDYYPGGFDIESDFPPPPEDFPVNDDLPPPPLPEYGDRCDTLRSLNRELEKPGSGSSGRRRPVRPQLYSLNQYLPHHSYPSDGGGGGDGEGQGASSASATITPASTVGNGGYRGEYALGCGRDFDSSALDDMSMSLYASTASCSDMSACCEESEAMISDYESGEEGHFEQLTIPMLNSQQHTEV